ncbi:hypothetical protein T484DRAFT_1758095 [Baffinella frigidus]|nr:hypothetical protein T484DRAFT_1758095 [Cryptophyta sp. CCMP2293]
MAQRLHLDELTPLYNTITPHLERLCNTSLDTAEHKFVYGVLDLYQHLSAGTSTPTPGRTLDPPHPEHRVSPDEQRSAFRKTGPVPVDSRYFKDGELHLQEPIMKNMNMATSDIVIKQLLSDRTYWWSQVGGLEARLRKAQGGGGTDEVERLKDQVRGLKEQMTEASIQLAASSVAAVKEKCENEAKFSDMHFELMTEIYKLSEENKQRKDVADQDEKDMGEIYEILDMFIEDIDDTMRIIVDCIRYSRRYRYQNVNRSRLKQPMMKTPRPKTSNSVTALNRLRH